MKKLLSTLLMVCCIATALNAQDESGQNVDFQILVQGHVDTPIYRSPAVIPVQGYYVSQLNTLFLSFMYNLGIVKVCIENVNTGEVRYDAVYSNQGIQALSLWFGSGLYAITLSTSVGQQYIAELLL